MLWQAERESLVVKALCLLASEMFDSVDTHIRDHDFGKLHKNAGYVIAHRCSQVKSYNQQITK